MSTRMDDMDFVDETDIALEEALRDDYLDACRDARIPSAGLVWWRASLRARAEAAESVERPLTIAHGIIGAGLAGAACAASALVWRSVPAITEPSLLIVVGLVAAVFVVVAPIALILALARD